SRRPALGGRPGVRRERPPRDPRGVPAARRQAPRHTLRRARARLAAAAARPLRRVQPRLRPRHAVRPPDGREHRGDPRVHAAAGRLGLRPPTRGRQPRGAPRRLPRPPRLAGDAPTGDGMNEPAAADRAGAGGPTGIVMLNLGGPKDLDEVEPFLLELFADEEIIQLPAQRYLGPFIAKRRVRSAQANYQDIGGGSPILAWTTDQGRGMCRRLDALSPRPAPHRVYVAFRYASPKSEDALARMKADGVRRAVAFTQYPQFSCATTGSSLNELWRAARRLGLQRDFEWSVIDRWFAHPRFVEAMTETVRAGLDGFASEERDDVLIVFSAHSLPMSVVNRGDAYPAEVGATVHAVMERLG